MGDARIIQLEDKGRLIDPERYAAALKEAEGAPVEVDAAQIPMITSLHLQVHLAAKRHWDAQGLPFDVVNTSDQFHASLAYLGWAENP